MTHGRQGVASSTEARNGDRGLPREEKNEKTGSRATRADKKAGKNYFGRSEGVGEKNKFGRERKTHIIRAGAKKNSYVNKNTTHKRVYVQ